LAKHGSGRVGGALVGEFEAAARTAGDVNKSRPADCR
jgi:hypothetical protein